LRRNAINGLGELAVPNLRREEAVQATIVSWFKAALPPDWLVIHHYNNPRSRIAGARLKRLGMMAGFPDLMILGPERRVHFAEIKCEADVTGDRTTLSAKQRQTCNNLALLGHTVGVLRSIEDAEAWAGRVQLPIRILPIRRPHERPSLSPNRPKGQPP
jgi:hypothetical protein